MNSKEIIKRVITIIMAYFVLFCLNNIRNIINIIFSNGNNIIFISISMVISLLIFYFYIFKFRKKINNIYFNISLIIMLLFYNLVSGNLYTANLGTFFFIYITLLVYSFALYLKYENFSMSLITSFCLLIIISLIIGMLGLLKIIKYLIPISLFIILIYLYKSKDKKIISKLNDFLGKELLIFTFLFIIAIVGGIGRYVHVYDEYSHWAYDAKAVIYYDKLSTSQEIMSQTRQYAPIITIFHYIVAQYSTFQEPNLYIGLSIFVSIFLMSVISNKKNDNKLVWLTSIIAYCSCFILGGVCNFNTLYADLAFGIVFGASFIMYWHNRDEYKYKLPLSLILIILTLIKPSGCTASFALLFFIMIDQLCSKKQHFISLIKDFIKKYWKIVLIVITTFLIWNIYVLICNHLNIAFYNSDIRPWTLKSDLSQKLNLQFIFDFVKKIINSLDNTIIYGSINLTLFKFLILLFGTFFALIYDKKNNNIFKYLNFIMTYIIFFSLTALSIFITFSYYEASIIASFERYLNSIHIAFIMLLIFICYCKIIETKKNYYKIIGLTIALIIILSSSFKNTFYFITDWNARIETQKISNVRIDKFKEVNEKTEENSKIFIIDQNDTDGIMAMWYARYYLFPRKVNASSTAITWKIRTEKNIDDLQDWGLTSNTLKEELTKYDFDYLFLYTKDKELYQILDTSFDDYKTFNKYDLYKINNDKFFVQN